MIDNETSRASDATVDSTEIAKFAAMAEEWWDPEGKFRPLHKFNPIRLEYLCGRIAAHFNRDPRSSGPFSGLTVVDVGCGGGLLTEPMARLGAAVTGIDATERNVEIARIHADRMGLPIEYRFATAADIVAMDRQFDIVLNMEVIEHVSDRATFIADCGALVRSGGVMFVATLNRTAKAYLLAIIGAEYVLGWLPRGTHDWRRFVRPSELAAYLRGAGLNMSELSGVTYSPIKDRWHLSDSDMDVNYIATAVKPSDN